MTQIYSDEASFETEKRIGVFTGHVRVFDPRFNLQSDKLTVFIHKRKATAWKKQSQKEMSVSFATSPIQRAVRLRKQSDFPIKRFTLHRIGMWN